MPARFVTAEHTFFDAKGATGAGTALNVKDFKHIVVTVATDGGSDAAMTMKCQGAISDTAPTWASAASVTNMWDYIHMYDLQNATGVDGDTGFVVATADDYRIFMVNVDALTWVNFRVTARTQGEVTVKGRGYEQK